MRVQGLERKHQETCAGYEGVGEKEGAGLMSSELGDWRESIRKHALGMRQQGKRLRVWGVLRDCRKFEDAEEEQDHAVCVSSSGLGFEVQK